MVITILSTIVALQPSPSFRGLLTEVLTLGSLVTALYSSHSGICTLPQKICALFTVPLICTFFNNSASCVLPRPCRLPSTLTSPTQTAEQVDTFSYQIIPSMLQATAHPKYFLDHQEPYVLSNKSRTWSTLHHGKGGSLHPQHTEEDGIRAPLGVCLIFAISWRRLIFP